MHLYILRHADAAPGHPDEERPLTEKGERDITRLCNVLKPKKAIRAEEIWESPFLRARQTTDHFCRELDLELPRHSTPALKPDENPARFARNLLKEQKSILVVGHNPHLELLISFLLTGRSNGAMVYFATGALACLENTHIRPDIGSCMLRWLISPKALRKS